VSLEWLTRVSLAPFADQRLFLHAVQQTPQGQEIVANGDHDPPLPTGQWPVGVPVGSGPTLLTFSREGDFELVAGLYDPGAGTRLPLVSGRSGDELDLGALRFQAGVGVQLDDRPHAEVRLVLVRRAAADELELMTEWWVDRALPAGQRVFLHALDAGGGIVANADHDPVVPSEAWPPLARRRERRARLRFDAGEIPGQYSLVTGLFDPQDPGFARLDFFEANAERQLVLGRVVLEGAPGRIDGVRFCPHGLEGCP
jgi:hypothetical protein